MKKRICTEDMEKGYEEADMDRGFGESRIENRELRIEN